MADTNDRQLPNADQPFNFPPPPAPEMPGPVKKPRLAALREWWDDAWDEGGVLYERWEDLRQVPELGWHGMANWVKVLLATLGFCVVVLFLDGAAGVLADAAHRLLTAAPRVQVGTNTSSGMWAVVDQPIRSYIAKNSNGLAISGSTIYTIWQAAGLTGLIGGFLRSSGARLLWLGYGAASIAMVWTASPETGRTLATGIAALLWTLASLFALRGLSLRPLRITHIHNPPIEIRPEIYNDICVHTTDTTSGDDTPHAPDNVHQLQQR